MGAGITIQWDRKGGCMRNSSVTRAITLLFFFITLCAIPVIAQDSTGSVTGDVKDESGQPLPGVMVSVVGEKGIKSTTSEASGKFTVTGLLPGTYDVKAELSGYQTVAQTGITVTAGQTAETALTMKPGNLQELMVVTASRIETPLINAPATMSVISSDAIESAPAQNYGDLLRNVPGLNVIQMSARDINLTSRQATSTLATSQLALLDGRTIYQDFFGFVLWDELPINLDEIKQIEVIRGPASAVWGANAQTGVVNIITKTPREMVGTSLTFTASVFDRTVKGGPDLGNGNAFGANVIHAAVLNDTWSYKLSAGYFDSDQYARPAGLVPASTVPGTDIPTGGFPYSAVAFPNNGTQQPKFDARFDQELGRDSKITYAAGIAGTQGIIHTGIGPFDIQKGTDAWYGKVNYLHGSFHLNFFANVLDGDAVNLLTRDAATGQPIDFIFKNQTYDVEAGHSILVHGNNMISFGGNFRRNNFDLSIAPLGDNRNEAGAYIQDEIFTDKFRFVLGGRVDKFSVLDNAVFSPRLTFMYKPTPEHAFRVSYNKAFRAPSLVNNFLNVDIISAVFDPRVIGIPGPPIPIVTTATGNADLVEESLIAYEVGYTGQFDRTTVSASYYINDTDNNINFTAVGVYTAGNPPPGWYLPPQILTLLAQNGVLFPSAFTYLNLGPIRNEGIELSLDQVVNDKVSFNVNYSWQKDPEILSDPNPFPPQELGFPSNHRFNVGVNYNDRRFLVGGSVNYASDAFWTDVLDARFWGPTDAYTMVNASFGVKWLDGRLITTVKATNLLNDEILQHIFGDVIKRNFTFEAKINL